MDNNDKPQESVQNGPAVDEVASHQPRGSFALKGPSRRGNKATIYIVSGALALCLALIVGLWVAVAAVWDDKPDAVDESSVKDEPGLQPKSAEDDAIAKFKIANAKREKEQQEAAERERKRLEKEAEQNARQESTNQRNTSSPDSSNGSTAQSPPPPSPKDRKLSQGVVVTVAKMEGSSFGASSVGGTRSQAPGEAAPKADGGDSLLAPGGSGLGSRSRGSLNSLSATPGSPTKAYLAPDGKYLLRNNTYARCALYTEVITEHESRLSCFLVSPLYSSDGSTLLADAGARMTGEQRIEMKPGQAQIFTQWNDLEVDSGQPGVPSVRTRFDALGTGPMGSSGTKGWIDNKYLERYGGAIVLTGFKDLLQAVSNTTQRGSGSGGYTINNSEQNVEDMATKTLDANINISPVGYLLPGTVINVTIARDIDFSAVYENR